MMELKIFKELASGNEPNIASQDITFSEKVYLGYYDSTKQPISLRHLLKRIRAENPRLDKAFRTGSFD